MPHAQTLIDISERANPGDPIDLRGDGLNSGTAPYACEVAPDGSFGRAVALKVLSRVSHTIQAEIPNSFQPGLWQVWVQDGGQKSNARFVNKADVFWTDQETAYEGSVVTLYGRNFQVLGQSAMPTVKLVGPGGGSEIVEVVGATPYVCKVRLPADVQVGAKYRLVINNGYGGERGDQPGDSITIVPPSDPMSLGVGWGTEFGFATKVINIQSDPRLSMHASGNGGEDQQAVQAAIQYASSHGGGTVYFPAGTYRIAGNQPLKLASNVVLRGDGPGKTFIDYGYNFVSGGPAPKGSQWGIRGVGCNHIGLLGITFRNFNTNAVANPTIELSASQADESHEVFVRDCDLQLGNGRGLFAENCRNLFVSDSSFESTDYDQSPIFFVGGWGVTFRHNNVLYRMGRLQFSLSTNVVIEDNKLQRDPTNPTDRETGCLEISGSRLTVARHNTITGLGARPTNDGELINSQFAGIPDIVGIAQVTSATSTSVTCSGANWPTSRKFATVAGIYNRTIAVIVNGKGMGQWRYVTANTDSVLTLDRPWEVVPDSSSLCAVSVWAADRVLILDNQIQQGTIAIELWNGGNKCVLDGNQCVDAGAIVIRGNDAPVGGNNTAGQTTPRMYEVAWDNWISNNSITEDDNLRPARISVWVADAMGPAEGNLAWDNEIRGNKIISQNPGFKRPDEGGSEEGIHVLAFHEHVPQPQSDTISNIGTLVIGNTFQNVPNPIHVSLAAGAVVR